MVENWGVGHPDFTGPPSGRTVLIASQTPVTMGTSITVPPGTVSFPVYAVPTGKRFVLGYIKSSSDISVITPGAFLKNGVVFCPLYACGLVIDQLPDTSGFVFDAGDVLGFTGTNPLNVPLIVSICLSGFLYDV